MRCTSSSTSKMRVATLVPPLCSYQDDSTANMMTASWLGDHQGRPIDINLTERSVSRVGAGAASRVRGTMKADVGLGPLWPPAVPLSDRLPILAVTCPLDRVPHPNGRPQGPLYLSPRQDAPPRTAPAPTRGLERSHLLPLLCASVDASWSPSGTSGNSLQKSSMHTPQCAYAS